MPDRTLTVPDRTLTTLARIKALVAEGFSQRQIVEMLNRSNTPAKCGGQWTRSSLRSVLKTHKRRLQLA